MITAGNETLVSVNGDDPIILSFTVTQTVPPLEGYLKIMNIYLNP